MAEEKKVKFSAEDNVSSFINKVRQESKKLFDEQLKNAKQYSKELKDQVQFMKEFINEFQRKSKMEQDAAKAGFNSAKSRYGSFTYQGKSYFQATQEEFNSAFKETNASNSMQGGILKEMLSEMKKDITPEKKRSIFSDIIKAGLLRDVGTALTQTANARNGTEIIPTMSGITGIGAGALAGFVAGGNSAAGAQIGKSIGEWAGTAMVRHLSEQSRFQGAQGRLRGTGGGSTVEDLSYLGIDLAQSAAIREQLVRSTGMRNQGAFHLAEIMKAFSLDSGLINQYGTGTRYGGGLVNLNTLLGTAGEKERPNFDRIIQNQTTLTNLIAQSQLTPNTEGIAKALFEFNKVGGAFGFNDPRSTGLISTISENISSPNSPLAQAMNYSILRSMNPELGIVGLLKEQQRGVENRDLTAGILGEIDKMGGSEDFKVLMTAQRFGLQNNIGAAEKLFRGRGDIGKMTDEDFTSFTDKEIRQQAEANTAPLEKSQARITNAFVTGMTDGISTVSKVFSQQMADVAVLAAAKFAEEFSGIFSQSQAGKQNDAVVRKYGSRTVKSTSGRVVDAIFGQQ